MKRTLDILFSLFLLLIASPFLMVIGIIIKLNSKGPMLFVQMRIGKNNKVFKFYKFRTMKVGTPNVATGKFDSLKGYITSIGKILRKSSLDEIPQLINILKGDMTFVGPRPALFNQYGLKMFRTKVGVHKLLPGVTGWAQVNGRDQLDDVMKTYYDEEYLRKKSFIFDVKILFSTVFKVLNGNGVIEGGKKNIKEGQVEKNVQA